MIMLFDNLKFRNNTHFGSEEAIVAEIGVEVIDIPTYVYTDEDKDVRLNITPGYYYVAEINKTESNGGVKLEDWGKRFFVSKESIFEYIYGIADENEPPEYIESYDRIADASDSIFLNYFLYMNRLIDESRTDQALSFQARRDTVLKSDIHTTIQIERIDKFSVVSHALTDELDPKEVRCEIIKDSDQGSCISVNGKIIISPLCWFIVNDKKGKQEEKYFTLNRAYDSRNFSCSKYFSCFVELEKATIHKLCNYFNQESSTLEKRFTKEEIDALKLGILGIALGVKEYP